MSRCRPIAGPHRCSGARRPARASSRPHRNLIGQITRRLLEDKGGFPCVNRKPQRTDPVGAEHPRQVMDGVHRPRAAPILERAVRSRLRVRVRPARFSIQFRGAVDTILCGRSGAQCLLRIDAGGKFMTEPKSKMTCCVSLWLGPWSARSGLSRLRVEVLDISERTNTTGGCRHSLGAAQTCRWSFNSTAVANLPKLPRAR